MVKRVAKAIWAVEDAWHNSDDIEPPYERMARAAIEAMREPTDDDLDAMSDIYIDGPEYVQFYPSFESCRRLINGFIDAALQGDRV